MNLDGFLESLALGELNNLYIGQDALTGWSDYNRRRVINWTSQGLKQITSRFPLLQKELVLQTVDNLTRYHLRREYATNNPSQVQHKYILDRAEEPFTGDVVKILAVYDSQGQMLPMNEEGNPDSIYTSEFDTLVIPKLDPSGMYSVIYQARSPLIDHTCNGCEHLDLPPMLEEALASYVAWKAYSTMNGQESTAKGQEHKARYEELCLEVENRDLGNTSQMNYNPKLHMRGFV